MTYFVLFLVRTVNEKVNPLGVQYTAHIYCTTTDNWPVTDQAKQLNKYLVSRHKIQLIVFEYKMSLYIVVYDINL